MKARPRKHSFSKKFVIWFGIRCYPVWDFPTCWSHGRNRPIAYPFDFSAKNTSVNGHAVLLADYLSSAVEIEAQRLLVSLVIAEKK